MLKTSKLLTEGISRAFFCLGMLFLVACSGSGPSQGNLAPLSQEIYRTFQPGVVTIDPAKADDTGSLQAIDMVFTGLVSLNDQNDQFRIQPQMASSWQMAGDGLTWTFHLRPDLKFSDGTSLTADDIVYSINRALQPSTNSPDCLTFLGIIKDAYLVHSGEEDRLDSVFAPDQNTLIITTAKKAPYFLRALTEACSFPVEEKLVLKYGNHFTDHLNEGGGDGPFIISHYSPTHGIDFVPNPYYYGPKPLLREVSFNFYQYWDNSYEGYKLGLVDMTPISTTYIDKYLNNANNFPEFHQLPVLESYFFRMNYLTKPFDNIHIRQAFALSINRIAIANNVLHHLAIPTYHIIPQGEPGYNPNLTGPAKVTDPAGDPVLAKELLLEGLREEGWASISQMPPITLTYGGGPNDPLIDAAINMWQTVLGVNITPDPVSDTNTFFDEINATKNNPAGLQIWAEGWVSVYVDPRIYTTQVFGSGEINNTVNYGQNNSTDATEQQTVQADLEAADTIANDNERYAAYDQAEQKLVNDVAWMPVYQSINAFLLKPYVKGITANSSTLTSPDDWAKVYIVAH